MHGQCLSVGVGGFTLGGGVNLIGASAKYGTAMEQVITVSENGVQRLSDERNMTSLQDDDLRKGTDIMFGLRGAGASFGIVTGKQNR